MDHGTQISSLPQPLREHSIAMHDTAYRIGKLFFDIYWSDEFRHIVEVGSLNLNGTLRDFCPPQALYTGLDLDDGPGVDIRIEGHANLPFRDNAADILISTSAFEHDPCFWETFLEMSRITRQGGFIYLNAPSNGQFHRYPIDCWRFYPDAGAALAEWACRRDHDIELVESFIADREGDQWNDFVAVFRKRDGRPLDVSRVISDSVPCSNVRRHDDAEMRKMRAETEDMLIRDRLAEEVRCLRGGD